MLNLTADNENKAVIYPIEFKTDFAQNSDGTYVKDEDGNCVQVEWATWARKGSANTTSDKVSRLKKGNPVVWSALEPHYEAWKKGENIQITGSPLEICAFVTKEQLKLLKRSHIYSCEEFVTSSDSILEKLGIPGIRALQKKVQIFLEAQEQSNLAAREVALMEAIEELKKENQEMRDLIQKLTADKPKRRKPSDIASNAEVSD